MTQFTINLFEKLKPSLLDKIIARDEIRFSENGKIVKTRQSCQKNCQCESWINNIKDKTLKEILKYKNHPSVNAIQFNLKLEVKVRVCRIGTMVLICSYLKMNYLSWFTGSFNSSKNFLFSRVRIPKSSFDVEQLQNQFLGLTCFLVSGDIPICSLILTFKCLTHSP